MMSKFFLSLILVTLISSSHAYAQTDKDESQQVKQVLKSFHQAAAQANFQQYFSLLTDNAVFIGTDSHERWTKTEFASFVKPYFSKGVGWSYQPKQQNISLQGNIAFFDELLWSDKYGLCRGTGVLTKYGDKWLISQYSLSIPIPNEIAKGVVADIKHFKQGQ